MDKIKVIFLDIDGVLRPATQSGFNKRCVGYINQMVAETGAKVVLSSTWRYYMDEVEKQFPENGIKFEIFDVTSTFSISKYDDNQSWIPDYMEVPRGIEIQGWLKEFNSMDQYVESYVILDDGSDILLTQLPHYIQVDQVKGLTKQNLKDSIRVLNSFEIPIF
jgi:hypothetical protein